MNHTTVIQLYHRIYIEVVSSLLWDCLMHGYPLLSIATDHISIPQLHRHSYKHTREHTGFSGTIQKARILAPQALDSRALSPLPRPALYLFTFLTSITHTHLFGMMQPPTVCNSSLPFYNASVRLSSMLTYNAAYSAQQCHKLHPTLNPINFSLLGIESRGPRCTHPHTTMSTAALSTPLRFLRGNSLGGLPCSPCSSLISSLCSLCYHPKPFTLRRAMARRDGLGPSYTTYSRDWKKRESMYTIV